MSLERTYYCDGPANPDLPGEDGTADRCPVHATAMVLDPDYMPGGMLRVTQNVQGGHVEELHFCSWDCILRYAARLPAAEIIHLDPPEAA